MTEDLHRRIDGCRVCRGSDLREILDLGEVPPANRFVDDPAAERHRYPLVVVYCVDCHHVQLEHTVDREYLFGDYPYVASESGTIPEHFEAYAGLLEGEYLRAGDLVVDVGSNDGGFLRSFSGGIRTAGVEPAGNVAAIAEDRGITTLTEYFTPGTASRIREEFGPAEVVTANNVLAHVDDLDAFAAAVGRLLSETGVFVVEVPYLVDLVSRVEFDTIYHEHVSYFSIHAIRTLLGRADLELFDVERLDRHGGSVRAFVQRRSADRPVRGIVDDLLALERAVGVCDAGTMARFGDDVARRQSRIASLLERLSADGRTVVGYGASAKGNVLLNTCGIEPGTVEYLVDAMDSKQGTYSPGIRLPVYPPSKFRADEPDYALLLAWNYADSILEKEAPYRESGGRFVVPQPRVDVR